MFGKPTVIEGKAAREEPGRDDLTEALCGWAQVREPEPRRPLSEAEMDEMKRRYWVCCVMECLNSKDLMMLDYLTARASDEQLEEFMRFTEEARAEKDSQEAWRTEGGEVTTACEASRNHCPQSHLRGPGT